MTERLGFKPLPGQNFMLRFSSTCTRSQLGNNECTDLTLLVEDKTTRERTGHPTLGAGAKEMKLLTLHTHACLSEDLKELPSSTIAPCCPLVII